MANVVTAHQAMSPYLVKPVVYGLNKSFGKIIVAGIELRAGNLIPVVKVLSNTFTGITLTLEEWKVFKSDFPLVRRYFTTSASEAEKMCNTRTEHCAHYTLLTTCYQHRAVSFGRNGAEDEEESRTHEVFGESAAKRFRKYSPNIVLLRQTFDMLVEISNCVDAHVQELERDMKNIQNCMDSVVSFVRENIKSGTTPGEIIASTNFLQGALEYVKEALGSSETEFIKKSLHMILIEIISMFRGYVADCASKVA